MRKLASAAIAFSAAVFLSNYIVPRPWLPMLAVALALCGAVIAALHRKWLRRIFIICLGMSVGFGLYELHARMTTGKAEVLEGDTCVIRAKLLEYPQEYDRYCRARIRLEGEGLPHLEAILYDNDKWISQAEPGQHLQFTGKLRSAGSKYGEEYDGYRSRDIYLTISSTSPILVTNRGFGWLSVPARLHHWIEKRTEAVFPEDIAPFMKALMLGDKSGLYADPDRINALSRAGFMHVVAVSGMHIAYLVGLLQLLFGRNRRSSCCCILLVWLFVLTAGAPPSAVRAGIMQTFLLAAPILKRENDPATSLSAALALILLANPYAAASVSLQLSFASMAGILCFADWFQDLLTERLPEGFVGSIGKKIADILAVTFSTMIFTLPLVALHFGYAAILSPLSGLLALWTVPLCFCGAYLACAVSALSVPIGIGLAWIVSWPGRFLLLTARWISSLPFAVVYMRNALCFLWLLFCYAAFLICALTRMDRRMKLLIPALLSAVALAAALTVTRLTSERKPGQIAVLDVGLGQCITVFSGKETVMIDCGSLWSLDNAGEKAGAYLRSCERSQVDLLLLTHGHEDHVNGVPMLLAMIDVKRIVMPSPEGTEAERTVREAAEKHGTELLFLQNDMRLEVGDIGLSMFAPQPGSEGNAHCAMALLSLGDYDMLVTGDAAMAEEQLLLKRSDLDQVEVLIVGHHGSDTASSPELLEIIGAETAVISAGYNPYGLPDEETLERLAFYGYTVYRTDRSGDIRIQIG